MPYQEKSGTLQLRYYLKKILPQTNEAVFTLRKADTGEAVGQMTLFHRKIIDQSKRQGTDGFISKPTVHHFPERIVIKSQKAKTNL